MNYRVVAALGAASLVCAGQAQAARVLVIDIGAKGEGTVVLGSRNSTARSQYSFTDFSFQAILPLEGFTPVQPTSDGLLLNSRNGEVSAAAMLSATGLDLRYSLPTFAGFLQYFFTANACFANPTPTVLPTGAQTVDPACGSFTASYSDGFSVQGYNFTGRVTSISFSEAEGGTVPSFVAFIPEPSTWALMLAGFGLVGYAMRRRARVAFA